VNHYLSKRISYSKIGMGASIVIMAKLISMEEFADWQGLLANKESLLKGSSKEMTEMDLLV